MTRSRTKTPLRIIAAVAFASVWGHASAACDPTIRYMQPAYPPGGDPVGGISNYSYVLRNGELVKLYADWTLCTLAGTSDTVVNTAGYSITVGNSAPTGSANTYAGVLDGAGGLAVINGVSLTLSGVNTYTGQTTITGSTLALTGVGSIANSSNVLNNGTFDISGTNAGASIISLSGAGNVLLGAQTLTLTNASGTFSGTISGSGGLTIASGTETLSGTNTYTGTTLINSGATLVLAGLSSNLLGNVVALGSLVVSGTSATISIANVSGSGSVNIGASSLTLTNPSGTFSGSLIGTGTLTTQGSGSLVLNGNNAAFTGTTRIASGTLEVGDINTPAAVLGGNVLVDTAGTLRGHGSITGNVTNNGTVAPGGSIGTLSVTGNYVQASNATLAIEVSPTAASMLKVSGSATLGGTLAITYDPGTYSAKTYTLVSANGVSGTFANTTSTGTANIGNLTSSLAYGSNTVDLVLAAAASGTPVVIAPTGTSIYAALGTTAVLGAQAQASTLLERMGRMGLSSPGTTGSDRQDRQGWIDATGSRTKVGGTNGEPGFNANRYGFLAGLDQRLGEYTVGVAGGFSHADVKEDSTGNAGTIDTIRASLYGSRDVGPVNLAATVGAGLAFLSQKRPFGAQGTAEGDHMGQEVNLGLQGSLPMSFGGVTVTPRVGLRYAYVHANGFAESGASGKDLSVGTDNVHSLQPYVGVTLGKAFGDSLNPVDVELRVGYAHELLDANRALVVTSQDGTLFAAPGASLPRGYLTAGAGAKMHLTKSLEISLNYDTVFNTSRASVQQGSLRANYRF
ncbi:autotransporter domain-containing protein [Pandoraea sp. PE-S2R-1]|uniref:autotransporter outer membrane beta-barrel domain-containing protein n=1 Tax=Pandoraea sp. PE-S2R-1 TaxID=1986994 RepID=UPI000B400D67|nr:autotransporter outer membrane beta-barrel domain-containing protein [Pandoraea sp. PE-S2R-1]